MYSSNKSAIGFRWSGGKKEAKKKEEVKVTSVITDHSHILHVAAKDKPIRWKADKESFICILIKPLMKLKNTHSSVIVSEKGHIGFSYHNSTALR